MFFTVTLDLSIQADTLCKAWNSQCQSGVDSNKISIKTNKQNDWIETNND